MQTKDLVRMANQIAAFFAAYPREEAVAETAAHIRRFWETRMRRQFLAEAASAGGLDEIAHAARERLEAEDQITAG